MGENIRMFNDKVSTLKWVDVGIILELGSICIWNNMLGCNICTIHVFLVTSSNITLTTEGIENDNIYFFIV